MGIFLLSSPTDEITFLRIELICDFTQKGSVGMCLYIVIENHIYSQVDQLSSESLLDCLSQSLIVA